MNVNSETQNELLNCANAQSGRATKNRLKGGWELDVNDGAPLRLRPGTTFAVCHGDEDDLEPVTIRQVNSTHVLLESRGDLNGWKPRGLIEGAIAEASAQQSPRMPP